MGIQYTNLKNYQHSGKNPTYCSRSAINEMLKSQELVYDNYKPFFSQSFMNVRKKACRHHWSPFDQDGSVNGGLKLKYYQLDPFLHVLSHVLKYNGQKTSKCTRRTREV